MGNSIIVNKGSYNNSIKRLIQNENDVKSIVKVFKEHWESTQHELDVLQEELRYYKERTGHLEMALERAETANMATTIENEVLTEKTADMKLLNRALISLKAENKSLKESVASYELLVSQQDMGVEQENESKSDSENSENQEKKNH